MLTPHIEDPKRKEELVRRAAQPETFGRTSIPNVRRERVALGLEESQEVIDSYLDQKEKLRDLRTRLVSARELYTQADNELGKAVADGAKKAEIDKLTKRRDDTFETVSTLEAELDKILNEE